MNSYIDGIKNCFNFSSRMGRRAFIIFHLMNVLAMILTAILAPLLMFTAASVHPNLAGLSPGLGVLSYALGLFNIFMILPSLSTMIRRLHDMDRSGWILLATLIPVAGLLLALFLLVWLSVAKGSESENRFGEPHVIS